VLWARSDIAEVYVGSSETAVATGVGRGGTTNWQACRSSAEGCDWAFALLQPGRRHMPRRPVRVWFSGALARPFVVRPVAGLRRRSEALKVATRLGLETGLTGALEIWLDHWHPDRMALAVAVERDVLCALESAAQRNRLKVVSLQPWWASALASSLLTNPEVDTVSIVEHESTTLLAGDGTDGFSAAHTYVPAPTREQERALLSRLTVASNLSAPKMVRASLSTEPEETKPFAAHVEDAS
jgi:hypothetical protein